MEKINVELGVKRYFIDIAAGAVNYFPAFIKKRGYTGPIVLISDNIVAKRSATVFKPVLKKLSNTVIRISVPSTERSKSLEVFENTVREISSATKGHVPVIVAVGGGVVGDLAGFVAATYRRGVPFVQIPTTLLAQVDSSIGGKVGIDLPAAKNLVGAFYQPDAVFVDTVFLKTLPLRQIRNGLAEIIKYGMISGDRLFEYLEKEIVSLVSLKKGPLEKVIYECARIKARVVEKDEYDKKDLRIILNFGHTLGHAVEAASRYSGQYNHGESVALGMLLASEISVRLDMMKPRDLERLKGLIKRAGLPTEIKGLRVKKIMDSQAYDKKFISGANRFVLPRRIGSVEVVEDIPAILIRSVLRKYIV